MKFMECYHVAKKKNINRKELNRKQRCLELCGCEVCSSALNFTDCQWSLNYQIREIFHVFTVYCV